MPPEVFESFFGSPRWDLQKALASQLEMIDAHLPSHSGVVRYQSLLRDGATQLKRLAVFSGMRSFKEFGAGVSFHHLERIRGGEASAEL